MGTLSRADNGGSSDARFLRLMLSTIVLNACEVPMEEASDPTREESDYTAANVLAAIRRDIGREGRARLEYTRRAFRALQGLQRPRILDVGCGTGVPTLELAKLSDGEILALDIDQAALDELSRKAREAGVLGRVRIVNRSMLELDFEEESFDVIWSEGAMFAIGFSEALEQWRKFLKPGGFLVIHEVTWLRGDPPQEVASHWQRNYPALRTAPLYIEEVLRCGYELIAHIPLPEDIWWVDYYGPLEERLRELRNEPSDPELKKLIAEQQREIEMYKRSRKWYGSAFFVMRRR